MKPHVLILDGVHEECANLLRNENFKVEEISQITLNELKSKISDVRAIVVRSKTQLNKEVIDAAPNLKIIARAGVGLDNIDVNYANTCGITVVNAEEAPSVTVAELVMGLIISLLRNIAIADHLMKEGKWAKSHLRGMELRGKTIGIIGAGRIGIEVLRRCKAFEMNPIVFDISEEQIQKAQELGAKTETDLPILLKKADIISIHIPLTSESKNLINAETIRQMKDGAFLINAARGGIVDEKAIHNALLEGKLGGYAADCFEQEPSPNKDLINLPNVVCTPHLGASTLEAQRTAAYIIAKKIIDHLC